MFFMSSALSLLPICPPVQSTHSILTISPSLILAATGTVWQVNDNYINFRRHGVPSGCHRFYKWLASSMYAFGCSSTNMEHGLLISRLFQINLEGRTNFGEPHVDMQGINCCPAFSLSFRQRAVIETKFFKEGDRWSALNELYSAMRGKGSQLG